MFRDRKEPEVQKGGKMIFRVMEENLPRVRTCKETGKFNFQ